MPKIPVYQQKIGMTAGPISPKAQTGAFTQVGKAYAQLGQSVQKAATVAGEFELARQNLEVKNVIDTKGREALDSIANMNVDGSIRTLAGYQQAFDEKRTQILGDVDAMEGLQPRQRRAIKDKLSASMELTRTNGSKVAFGYELQDKTVAFNDATTARLERIRGDVGLADIEVAAYEQEYEERIRLGLKPALTPEAFRVEAFAEEALSLAATPGVTLERLDSLSDEIVNGEGKYSGMLRKDRAAVAAMLNDAINGKVAEVKATIDDRRELLLSDISFGNDYREQASALVSDAKLINDYELQYQLETDFVGYDVAVRSFGTDGFMSLEGLNANRAALVQAQATAQGEEARIVARKALASFDTMFASRQKAMAEDPVGYIYRSYEARGKAQPSAAQIISAQVSMGVAPENFKLLTNEQATTALNAVSEAQSPQEMLEAVRQVPHVRTNEAEVIRQLSAAGMTISQNYIISNPNSDISQTMLKALQDERVVGEKAPTKAQRNMIDAVVQSNQDFKDHMASMGGRLLMGFSGDEVMSMGIDTPAMANARKGHRDMVANLAIYLAAEDGKFFGKGGIQEMSELEPYVASAARIISDKYSYVDVNGSKMRVQKAFEGPVAQDIKTGMNLAVNFLNPNDIIYESDTYAPGTPEYEAEKAQYIQEVTESYQVITQNGDMSAVITDKTGGAVMVREQVGREVREVPLSISFTEAVNIVSLKGRAGIDEITERAQEIARELRDMPASEKRTEAGQQRIAELKAERQGFLDQINEMRRTLAEFGE